MKTIITILKNIFTPFSAFAFLILGIIASLCSAVIEFLVLRELLAITGLGINSDSWTALLVLVLEGSKFTLHFYGEALKKNGLSNMISEFDIERKRKLIENVKNSLVALSLICSLIFIVNILYNDSDKKINQALSNNALECDTKYNDEVMKLETNKTKQIDSGIALYDTEKETLDSLKIQHANLQEAIKNEPYIYKRGDLQEEADALRTQIDVLQTTYNDHISSVQENAESDFNTALVSLEARYGINGSERLSASDPEIINAGDNEYLSNFLLAFTKTFFNKTYSRGLYFLCAIIISLIVAVVLELCIHISQTLLTISVESFLKIIGDIPKVEKGEKLVNICIWLLFSTLITTSIYLLINTLSGTAMTKSNLIIALITYGSTIILLNFFTTNREKDASLEKYLENRPKTNWVLTSIGELLANAVIPAALAFAGYILIGFLYNGNFAYGDMNGLAIAIGGAFSKVVKYNECKFVIG